MPLAAELGAEFALPVAVVNDANAAALAELTFGEGTATNLICVRVDEGVGAGLVLDGRLFAGSSYAAGEIGHVVVDPDGARCACGKRGCLETEVSEPLLARLLEADGSDGTAVLDRAGEHLGTALATVLSALDVTDVVLSGQRPGHHRDVPRRGRPRRSRPARCRSSPTASSCGPARSASTTSSSAPPPGSSTVELGHPMTALVTRSDPRGHGVTRLGITRAEPQHQRPVPSRRTTVNRTRSVRMLAVLATAGLLVAACGGRRRRQQRGDRRAGRHRGAGRHGGRRRHRGADERPPPPPTNPPPVDDRHRHRRGRHHPPLAERRSRHARTRWSSTPSPSSTRSTPTSRS